VVVIPFSSEPPPPPLPKEKVLDRICLLDAFSVGSSSGVTLFWHVLTSGRPHFFSTVLIFKYLSAADFCDSCLRSPCICRCTLFSECKDFVSALVALIPLSSDPPPPPREILLDRVCLLGAFSVGSSSGTRLFWPVLASRRPHVSSAVVLLGLALVVVLPFAGFLVIDFCGSALHSPCVCLKALLSECRDLF